MRVKVCVSAVAKLCGFNPYVSRAQAIDELRSTLKGDGRVARAKVALASETSQNVVNAARVLALPAVKLLDVIEAEHVAKMARIENVRCAEVRSIEDALQQINQTNPQKRELAVRSAKELIAIQTAKSLADIVPGAATVDHALEKAVRESKSAQTAIMPEVMAQVSQVVEKKAIVAEGGDVAASALLATLPISNTVEQQRRMASGTLFEKQIAENIAITRGYECEGFEYEPEPRSTLINYDCGITIWLVGRADAIAPDEHRVIEIKKRCNRLLGCPEYDRVQLECYMRLYKLENGSLFEEYDDEIVEHKFVKCDRLWKKIVDGLEEVCSYLVNN